MPGAGGGVSRAGGDVPEEAKSLDSLYADARHEGGTLVIYAGGDTADQQDAAKQAFLSQFPEIDLTLIVDYSKYHDARIDNQLATGTLVPDVVQLQTTQDFTRWKEAGVLRPYKPSGFSKVYPGVQGSGRRLGGDCCLRLQLHVRRRARRPGARLAA